MRDPAATEALTGPTMAAVKSMDEIVALCKRRGFVYPASEIYGGINGFWDYGPLGTQLKNNIRDHWWRRMVECPPIGPDGAPLQVVGLDSAIIQNPATWVASGHVGGFNDPMQTCRQCKRLFRADHVWDMLRESAWVASLLEALGAGGWDDRVRVDAETARRWAGRKGKALAAGLALVRDPDGTLAALAGRVAASADGTLGVTDALRVLGAAPGEETPPPPCPHCGGDLTEPRLFNLMFESHVGAVRDDASTVYLRPETAQGIFLNFKNVLDTMRVRVPFGIAQVGKAFRNEVTPRNFVFRSREFEQMELEWFCHQSEATTWYEFWKQERMQWWRSLGIDPAHLRFRDHAPDELAHYSKMCVDIEYRYPFTAPGFGELEGIAHRGCFDLDRHQEHARQKLEYFDADRNERYLPNVIEPASGLTRGALVLICEAFTPTPDRQGSKYILRFKPRFAPITAGIFPLIGKDGMPEIAQKLYLALRERFVCQFDVKQSIGKRYARMDEAGTPYCFTIDGQTVQDETVTVRERDTATQDRIHLNQVESFLIERLADPST